LDKKNGTTKINKRAIARVQHPPEVRAGELGHVEEIDGVEARDATIPIYNARRLKQPRAQVDEQDQKGIGDQRRGSGIGFESAKVNHSW
jgi:hypothetical protein